MITQYQLSHCWFHFRKLCLRIIWAKQVSIHQFVCSVIFFFHLLSNWITIVSLPQPTTTQFLHCISQFPYASSLGHLPSLHNHFFKAALTDCSVALRVPQIPLTPQLTFYHSMSLHKWLNCPCCSPVVVAVCGFLVPLVANVAGDASEFSVCIEFVYLLTTSDHTNTKGLLFL